MTQPLMTASQQCVLPPGTTSTPPLGPCLAKMLAGLHNSLSPHLEMKTLVLVRWKHSIPSGNLTILSVCSKPHEHNMFRSLLGIVLNLGENSLIRMKKTQRKENGQFVSLAFQRSSPYLVSLPSLSSLPLLVVRNVAGSKSKTKSFARRRKRRIWHV